MKKKSSNSFLNKMFAIIWLGFFGIFAIFLLFSFIYLAYETGLKGIFGYGTTLQGRHYWQDLHLNDSWFSRLASVNNLLMYGSLPLCFLYLTNITKVPDVNEKFKNLVKIGFVISLITGLSNLIVFRLIGTYFFHAN